MTVLHAMLSSPLACLPRCPLRRGDQGFLNSYFQGFASAPVFDPGLDEASAATLKYMRLPTRYNADIGLYVINGNKWSIPTSEIRWAVSPPHQMCKPSPQQARKNVSDYWHSIQYGLLCSDSGDNSDCGI